jgi:hypothetical protein
MNIFLVKIFFFYIFLFISFSFYIWFIDYKYRNTNTNEEEDDTPVNSITPIISDSDLLEEKEKNSQNSSVLTNIIVKPIFEDQAPHNIEYIKYSKSPILISNVKSDKDHDENPIINNLTNSSLSIN